MLTLTSAYIMEILKYILCMYIFFHKSIQRRKLVVVSLFVYFIIILAMPVRENVQLLVMYICAITTVVFSYLEKSKKNLISIMYSLFILTCLDAIMERINEIISTNNWANKTNYLLNSIVINILLLIILLIKKHYMKGKNYKKFVAEYMEILVVGMITNILLTIAGIHILQSKVGDYILKNFFQIMSILSYVTVICLILFIAYVGEAKRNISECLSYQIQLKQMQESYYLSLLQREEDTRQSRHDWGNHLLCLTALAEKEKALETKQYVDKLLCSLNEVKGRWYEFGNDVINVIVNYYIGNASKDIEVVTTGRIRAKLKIDETDLCEILSNLIKNAIEYLEKNDLKEKKLYINIESGKLVNRIIIKNNIDSNFKINHVKKTSKDDKRNHGYGIKNAKKAVERCGGTLQFQKEGQFFVVIATIF